MRTANGRTWMVAATLVLAIAPLAAGRAQTKVASLDPRSSAGSGMEPGAELRAKAHALLERPGGYAEAAALLQEAAELTPVEDGQRVRDLRLAANLLFFAKTLNRAESVMAQAAEAALARGDVLQAANSFMDAGWLAARRNREGEARAFANRALHLTASPLLTPTEREAIRQRVSMPPEPPAVS